MQGEYFSKIPSLLQKEILAKENFNLGRKLRKTFDNMANHFANSHSKEESPFQVTSPLF